MSVALDFETRLEYGQLGESAIARWFKGRGFNVLPVYDVEINTGKGPRLFTPNFQLIAPDMLVFKSDGCYWIEAKHKTAFTWHRITQRWVTGIDLRHYADYCQIDDDTPFPVWLMFLHEGGQAKDSPANSPAGLFGNTLKFLRDNENHRSNNFGKGGMVYWSIDKLKKIADSFEPIKGA